MHSAISGLTQKCEFQMKVRYAAKIALSPLKKTLKKLIPPLRAGSEINAYTLDLSQMEFLYRFNSG